MNDKDQKGTIRVRVTLADKEIGGADTFYTVDAGKDVPTELERLVTEALKVTIDYLPEGAKQRLILQEAKVV